MMDANNQFESSDFKRTRALYRAQCTFEYFVAILAADAFLAKLLTHMGISDSLIGIIASFVNLAFLCQLLKVFVHVKNSSFKRTTIWAQAISMICYILLFLLPFIPVSPKAKTAIVVMGILTPQIGLHFVSPYLYKWANSYVSLDKRARYSAVKEIISLILGIVFTLIVGAVVDYYEGIGNIRGAFLFIAISIFVIAVLNLISLISMKKEVQAEEEQADKIPLLEIFKNTFGNRSFLNVIIMSGLFNISRYFVVGFLGTFKTSDLLFSVATIQIINMIGNVCRIFVSVPFGKYSDKYSFVNGMKLAFILEAVATLMIVFTNQTTRWGILVYTILNFMSIAGTNQNSFNITYSYVDKKYFVYALAIKQSVSGLLGFCSALVAGKVLAHIQANGNMFMGMHVYGQQILAAVSVVIMIVNILFTHFVIEKQAVKHQ